MPICNRCDNNRGQDLFIGTNGRILKTCSICREKCKCPCGKKRSVCKEHGGGGLCSCGKIRSQCKEHGGGTFCPCGKARSRCKEHGGGSYCQHDKIRGNCAVCKAQRICIHKVLKKDCEECPPDLKYGHKKKRQRLMVTDVVGNDDIFDSFIRTKCIIGENLSVSKRQLEQAYQKFLPKDKRSELDMFSRKLEQRDIHVYMKGGPKYFGISLISEEIITTHPPEFS